MRTKKTVGNRNIIMLGTKKHFPSSVGGADLTEHEHEQEQNRNTIRTYHKFTFPPSILKDNLKISFVLYHYVKAKESQSSPALNDPASPRQERIAKTNLGRNPKAMVTSLVPEGHCCRVN